MKKTFAMLLLLACLDAASAPTISAEPDEENLAPPPGQELDLGFQVVILSPVPNQVFTAAEAMNIDFEAQVNITGPEDPGPITVTWSSNRDDELGTGTELTAPLEVGSHRITAGARNGMGARTSTKIEVGVVPDPPTETPVPQLERVFLEDSKPAAASDEGGTSLLVWHGDDDDTQGDRDSSIQGLLLDPEGEVLAGRRINLATAGPQQNAAVAHRPNGFFQVVWHSLPPGQGSQTRGRAWRVDGSGLDEHRIDVSGGSVGSPRVAGRSENGFVVVWQKASADPFGDPGDIVARRLNNLGIPVDQDEIPVNSQTDGLQTNPTVAALPSGGFVVAWQSHDPSTDDLDESNIHLRRFDNDGSPLDAKDIQVNLDTLGAQTQPALATNRQGDLVVIWRSSFDTSPFVQTFRIAGRPGGRFEEIGLPFGDEFVVTMPTEEDDPISDPAVAMNTDGDFLVAWTRESVAGTPEEVRFRTFFYLDSAPHPSSETSSLGDELVQGCPTISFSGTGNDNEFLAFWQIAEEGALGSGPSDLTGKRLTFGYTLSEPVPPPGPTEVIVFADGFESGDMLSWDYSSCLSAK